MTAVQPKDLMSLLSTRRVCRDFAPETLNEDDLLLILDAARWATSAGNTRVQRFLVLQDPVLIRLAKALAPGVLSTPPAIIVICTDLEVAAQAEVRVELDSSIYVDVGTAAMSMMAEAHALGLGTCPATSFSQGGVRAVLGLPERARPEMLLLVGYPRTPTAATAPRTPRHPSRRLAELAYWGRYGDPPPDCLLRTI
jgi:nitroreductase